MADSLLFPVFGSITLLSIFLIFKYLGTEWINKILGIYCGWMCAAAAPSPTADRFARIARTSRVCRRGHVPACKSFDSPSR
jgi:hypothetical protein